jgi:hypothetical protein
MIRVWLLVSGACSKPPGYRLNCFVGLSVADLREEAVLMQQFDHVRIFFFLLLCNSFPAYAVH